VSNADSGSELVPADDQTESSAGTQVERRVSALSFKPFRIYFGGTVLAMNALRLGAVAQGLLMWELTGSPLSLGGVAAATAIPMMLVNIFGGVFADRYEAKFLLGGSAFIGALLFVLLGVLDFTNTVQPYSPGLYRVPINLRVRRIFHHWCQNRL